MSRAFVDAEQNAKDGVLELLPEDRNPALRPEENTNGSVPAPLMPPGSLQDVGFPPSGTPQVAPTFTPVTLTPDAEFWIIEAELANCERTREALARREAVLRERKAEIVRETKMRLDKEVRELASRDKEEEEVDEGLYMRNVQRKVEARLKRMDAKKNEVVEKNVQQVEEVKEEKVVPISAPERRRLTRLALFKNDPRLG